MKKKKIFLGILIVAWLCFIWGHSLQPSTVSDEESGKWLEILSKVFTFLKSESGMFIVRKSAHFTEYGILGILLALEFANYVKGWFRRFVEPVASAMVAAVIDETIQLFVPGRSGQVSDIWIDTAGAALGILITLAIINMSGSKFEPVMGYNQFNVGLMLLVLGVSALLCLGISVPIFINSLRGQTNE